MLRTFSLGILLLMANGLLAQPEGNSATPITAVAERNDGKVIAVGKGAHVLIFEVEKKQVVDELSGFPGRVTALTFDQGGRLAVGCGLPGQSGVVALYQPSGARYPQKPALIEAHLDSVYGLAFSPSGTLATASYDKTAKLWNLPSNNQPVQEPAVTITEHSDSIYAVGYAADGSLLATAAADNTVKLWQPKTGKKEHTFSVFTDWVYALSWDPTGKRLAAGGVDKSIRLWDLTGAKPRLQASTFAHNKPIIALAYAKGNRLVSLDEEGTIKVWDAAKLREIRTDSPLDGKAISMTVGADGKRLSIGSSDGKLVLVDLESGQETVKPFVPTSPPPVISRIEPGQIIRGQTGEYLIRGQRLDRLSTGKATVAGVEVELLEAVSGTERKVRIKSTPATPIGIAELQFGTSENQTVAGKLWVDRFQNTQEQGDNSSAANAMPVSLSSTVVGRLDRDGEVDHYRFSVKAGQQLGVQLLSEAPPANFEPVIRLSDLSGFELAQVNSNSLGHTFDQAGEYVLSVRDRQYRGNVDYRLHMGDLPVVTGVFPMAVQAGQKTPVKLYGVNLPMVPTVEVEPKADSAEGAKLNLPLPRQGGDPVGNPQVTVTHSATMNDDQPTDTAKSLTNDRHSLGIDGRLVSHNGLNEHTFKAKLGQPIIVEVMASRLGSPLDSVIDIVNEQGEPIPQAVLRCTALTNVTFRDHDSTRAGIRLDQWNELATDDYLYSNGELMRIKALPRNPDDDCRFYEEVGKRVGYLGTTPVQQPLGSPMYRVEIHPPGSTFPPNGMPTFTLFYRNDDGGPRLGKDSRIRFVPPADGNYRVRVRDAAGRHRNEFGYRLLLRRPQPNFNVSLSPNSPQVWEGEGTPIDVVAHRIDDFDGPISFRFVDLPDGIDVPDSWIEAGQQSATVPLRVNDKAMSANGSLTLKLEAKAEINGETVKKVINSQPIKLLPKPELVVRPKQQQVKIVPGGEARLVVEVDRQHGFDGRIPLDLLSLPHGVKVLNVGLSGILVLPGSTTREIVIEAEPWVKPMTRPIVVMANREGKSPRYAGPTVTLIVEPPADGAAGGD